MSIQSLSRAVGPVSIAAAVLIIVSQSVNLGLGLTIGVQSADSITHTLKYGLALFALYVLMLALTGLYLRQAGRRQARFNGLPDRLSWDAAARWRLVVREFHRSTTRRGRARRHDRRDHRLNGGGRGCHIRALRARLGGLWHRDVPRQCLSAAGCGSADRRRAHRDPRGKHPIPDSSRAGGRLDWLLSSPL